MNGRSPQGWLGASSKACSGGEQLSKQDWVGAGGGYMVQNRLQNQRLNPITFVDHVKNLVLYFKCHELLSRGFNSRGWGDTIISVLWKCYSGCSVEVQLQKGKRLGGKAAMRLLWKS